MDQPGASARREHERRRAAREREARERHPRIGGLLLKLNGAPAHERSWELGAEGEERVAARLEQLLLGTGVVLLHDRRLPRSRANIDHLAVGPGGITVIDAKRLRGGVDVRGRGPNALLKVGGRDRSKLIDRMERQLAAVRNVVPGVDVRGALCFVDPAGLPLLRRLEARGVLVASTRGVAKLANRSGTIGTAPISEIASRLAAAFPPAAA